MAPIIAIYILWGCWVISWWFAALTSHPTIKHAGLASELSHRFLTVVGVVLLFGLYMSPYEIDHRFWRTLTGMGGWAMVALTIAGFGFSWWARLHLGRLWSASVTRKLDHHIVDTGPYAIVRHPIYTGIAIAAVATALVSGSPSSLVGAALIIAGFYVKARIEERFLREELGPAAYDVYAGRVPMLVPFWPASATKR